MTADYRVELTVGAFSWIIDRGDPPSLPEILDGLHVGWQMPQTSFWPTQPEPTSAAFSILAAEADDLAGIDVGTPVWLRIYAGVVSPLEASSVALAGRVSQLDGRPMTYPDLVTGDLVEGWRLDVKVADYTADLAETDVAGKIPDFGWLGTQSNMSFICQVAGVPFPDWTTGGAGCRQYVIDDGNFKSLTFRDAADRYLRNTADGGDLSIMTEDPLQHDLWPAEGWRRGIIRPKHFGGELDPVTPWEIEWVSRKTPPLNNGVVHPARFANLGAGVYGPEIHAPLPAADIGLGGVTPIIDCTIVIDADYVDREAAWTRSKFTEPNTVIVTNDRTDAVEGDWRKVTRTNRTGDDPVIAARLTDTLIYDEFAAGHVAEMYLDEDAAVVRWVPSSFTWYASEDPSWPIWPSWFPDDPNWLGYSVPVVLTGIPASQLPGVDPDGLGVVVGIPRTVDFNMSGGEFRFDLQLIPRIPRPRNDGYGLTFNDLRNDFPAVRHQDLARPYSSLDYRLIRSTRYDY